MAKERKASDVVMCDGVPAANYRGISRLLWYIYDRKVSRIEAAKLIHEYTVAWADNRDKVSRSGIACVEGGPHQNAIAKSEPVTDATPR